MVPVCPGTQAWMRPGRYAMQCKRSGHGMNENNLDRKGSLKGLAALWRGRNVVGYAWALVPTGWAFLRNHQT
jgi:hypothetical protein